MNVNNQLIKVFNYRETLMSKAKNYLQEIPVLIPLFILILSILVFGLLVGDRFFSAFALTLILQQVAIVGIIGVAQSIVILTAGIDLSVGAIAVLSSVVMGKFTIDLGLPPEIAILCGLLCGAFFGAINGAGGVPNNMFLNVISILRLL